MNRDMKPHLNEVQDLYKKICEFESAVKLKYTYNPMDVTRRYIKEDIDTVMDAFSKKLNFTSEELSHLKDAMHSGEVDFMLLGSGEKVMDEEEFPLLYIISRPFFKAMRNSLEVDNIYWQKGRCPVCGAVPTLSIMEKESQRKYSCSFCGCVGNYLRIGCPNCLTESPEDITIISLDGEEGMRADICENCKSYCKSFEGSMTAEHSLDLLDLISLPLDIIVQGEGYKRLSPNPVGMIRMD